MSSLFSQAMKPIPILSVLLFVYTLTVISRVPHSVLNEMGHRKWDAETLSTAKANVFKMAASGKAAGQIESNGIALNPDLMEGADQSRNFASERFPAKIGFRQEQGRVLRRPVDLH